VRSDGVVKNDGLARDTISELSWEVTAKLTGSNQADEDGNDRKKYRNVFNDLSRPLISSSRFGTPRYSRWHDAVFSL
jgi:hypothetical protein